MNLDKTEVMWVGKQREDVNIRLEGKVKNIVCIWMETYLKTGEWRVVEMEGRRRIPTGANARRNVEGVMTNRNISRKLKKNGLDSYVVPASTYGLKTLALSEMQQHKLHVSENNWVRRIAGVKRVERRRMKDLREEIGIKIVWLAK